MRTPMLLVRTARWLDEILLLDFDPLIVIDGLPPAGSRCTVAIRVSAPSGPTA